MNVGIVDSIWRYPAKSMQGEHLDRAELGADGIIGDRGWAVRDERRGGIRGAKKIPGLMQLTARYMSEPESGASPPPIEIRLPDGTVTASERADVAEQLSAALDWPVTLWPIQPATDLDHYRRGAADSDDLLVELRGMFGRDEDEPLPDFSTLPPELIEFESPPGTYFDAYPILVMTTGSLRRLAELAPDSAIDVRRFRPNLVVDTSPSAPGAWPEQAWVGRSIRIGSAELDVVGPCPRCVMVTRAVGELPADREPLRQIIRRADQNLGVYASVRQAGAMKTGDPVSLS